MDRLARRGPHGPNAHAYFSHLKLLEDKDIDLWLYEERRRMDYEKDRILMHAKALASAAEGRAVPRRTHAGIRRKFIETGRGYPGVIFYGTVRDPDTQRLVEDPAQMEIVHWLFKRYAALSSDDIDTRNGSASLRAVQDELKTEKGVSISYRTLQRLLRDPLYVTGEWSVTYKGQVYAGEAIKWTKAIPLDRYQRVQQLLEQRRGRRSKTREGDFALNGILVHQSCMHDKDDTGRSYRLRGTLRPDAAPIYRHTPRVPQKCRGFTVARDVVEPVVMRAVRDLANDPVLQREWATAAVNRPVKPGPIVSVAELNDLRAQYAKAERNRQKLDDSTAERILNGEEFDHAKYDALNEALRAQLHRLQARITEAEQQHALQAAQEVEDEALETAERPRTNQTLIDEINQVLTDHVPDDPELRVKRTALIRSLLHAVELREKDGKTYVVLHGWIVPEHAQRHQLPGVLEVLDGALKTTELYLDGGEIESVDPNHRDEAEADAEDGQLGRRANRTSQLEVRPSGFAPIAGWDPGELPSDIAYETTRHRLFLARGNDLRGAKGGRALFTQRMALRDAHRMGHGRAAFISPEVFVSETRDVFGWDGVARRRRLWSASEDEELLRLFGTGLRICEVAGELRRTSEATYIRAKSLGVMFADGIGHDRRAALSDVKRLA